MSTVVTRHEASVPFFDGTARGEFLFRRCTRCAAAAEPQARQCPSCSATELAWEAASGSARLVSWAVAHDKDASTTVLVIAELAEGPWWWSQLVDADRATIEIGMPLRIGFMARAGSEIIPVFRPEES